MARWLPFLLPLAAAACVAVVATAALRDGGVESSSDGTSDAAAATETETPMADLRRPGNVCQGTLTRPAKGEPPRFAAMYTQRRDVLGIPVVGIDLVAEEAFDVAEDTIRDMLEDPALREPLTAEGAYVVIADETQKVLELPEFACLAGTSGASIYDHVCGVADRADYPVVTVSELDLIGDRSGPCRGLNVLYHELGHLVQGWVLGSADYVDVRLLYQEALDTGKYEGEYAARNTHEYFAESTQAYFLSIDRAGRRDRDWLKRYDPGMYQLLASVYGE